MNESLHQPAAGALRDAFLASLDAGDRARALELALLLGHCPNPLPSATCAELGLPARSTYAAAARQLLRPSAAA
jgi:hypothetical protein